MLDINLHPFTVLHTQRLTLRALKPEDAEDAFVMRADKELAKYIDRPLPQSMTEVYDWMKTVNDNYQANNGIMWVIAYNNNDRMIGTIGYWRMDKEHHRAEIGYTLTKANQGKGLMNEALKAVIKYGFNQISLHSIEANVNPHNQPSIKLLEKSGFVREGYFRENYYHDGKFLDSAIYSLVKTKNHNFL